MSQRVESAFRPRLPRMTLWDVFCLAGITLILAMVVASARRPTAQAASAPTWFDSLSVSDQRDSLVAQEARRAGVPVRLAIAVSRVENWSGDSMAVSVAGARDTATIRRAVAGDPVAIDVLGAVGLMQVLPRKWWHTFETECGCGSLFDRRRNACKGVRVLGYYLVREKTVDAAVRGYHGSLRLHTAGDGYASAVLEQLARGVR